MLQKAYFYNPNSRLTPPFVLQNTSEKTKKGRVLAGGAKVEKERERLLWFVDYNTFVNISLLLRVG